MKQEGPIQGEGLLSRFVRDVLKQPVVVVDRAGRVVDANRAAREAKGLDVVLLFENGRADPRLTAFLSELRARKEHGVLLELVTESGRVGKFTLEGALVDEECVVVVHDCTERSMLDEEVRQLRRVQALGFVTASVIHDFNNLMVPILCLSEMLAKELGRTGPAATLAADVHFAAERAASLVRDVHALTRSRSAAREATDLSAVVVELQPLIERMLGGSIDLNLALEQRLGDTLVDREQLEHAILNLIANARDAMPHGGRLTLSTANVAFVGGRPSDDGSTAPSYVALVVEDTGVGMTEAVRARVFDRFYTTKDAAGGSGLGLASVQRFVDESGGLIALHSEPGRGTLVTIHLPRVGRSEQPTIPDLGRAETGGRGETILVVDDDEPVRRTVKAVLEARGYQVIGARSAEDALRSAESGKPPIDLALVDSALPRTDYPRFLQRLRASAGGAGILFMSTAANPSQLGPRQAADRMLKKAFSVKDLVRETRAALDAASSGATRRGSKSIS